MTNKSHFDSDRSAPVLSPLELSAILFAYITASMNREGRPIKDLRKMTRREIPFKFAALSVLLFAAYVVARQRYTDAAAFRLIVMTIQRATDAVDDESTRESMPQALDKHVNAYLRMWDNGSDSEEQLTRVAALASKTFTGNIDAWESFREAISLHLSDIEDLFDNYNINPDLQRGATLI